jgi:hypothetical protein
MARIMPLEGRSRQEVGKDRLLSRFRRRRSIEVASDERIEAKRAIADRILTGAIGFPPEDVIVSDESSLSDFALEDGVEVAQLQERIGRMFDVDISHIEDGVIADVAEYVAEDSPRV